MSVPVQSLFALASTTSHRDFKAPIAFYIIAPLIVVYAAALFINPRLQWKMMRWQFKNASTLEPSAKGLAMIRVSSAVVVIAGLVIVIVAVVKS